MIAIRGHQISKTYGHYQVLQDVSLEVAAGECYALFGANGSGKTTLLKIFATLSRPSAGQFEIMGRDGMKEKETVRTNLLLLAHGSHLYDDLNAAENIQFALALRGSLPTDRQIKVALDHVAIGAFADMKVRYFSAGMKKRLALAKAILVRPAVLLLDEPFTALDEEGIKIMKRYIRDMTTEGGAVLMSTHDRDKAAEVAQQAGVINQGILQPMPLPQ